jgi:hypothetical protein
MPRKKKQQIKVNNQISLEGLLQETYNDACSNIKDAQTTINEMSNAAEPVDIDDLTKLAKGKVDALKVKESSIKIKLEIAKLQNDTIKHSGNVADVINKGSNDKVSLDDMKKVRQMIEDKANGKVE